MNVYFPIVSPCIGLSQQPSIFPPVMRPQASIASQATPCEQLPIIGLSSTSFAVHNPSVSTDAVTIGEQYHIVSSPCNSLPAGLPKFMLRRV